MTRKIDPADRLALPRLSAAEATALTRKLLVAFEDERSRKKAPKLPKLVLKTAKKLEGSVVALEAALESRVGTAEAPKEGQAADLVMDRAVHALHGFLESWATIPDTQPENGEAQGILDALFKDGLSILKLRYAAEWAEVKALLAAADADGHAATIGKLGGKRILDSVRKAFTAYGEALGITVAGTATPGASVAEPRRALLGAIKAYVRHVSTAFDEDEADEVARRDSLLLPLASWESARRSKNVEESSDDGD